MIWRVDFALITGGIVHRDTAYLSRPAYWRMPAYVATVNNIAILKRAIYAFTAEASLSNQIGHSAVAIDQGQVVIGCQNADSVNSVKIKTREFHLLNLFVFLPGQIMRAIVSSE